MKVINHSQPVFPCPQDIELFFHFFDCTNNIIMNILMIYAFYPLLNYSLKVSSQKRDYQAKGYDFLACDSSFQTVFERLTTLHCSLRLSFIMMLIMFLFFFLNEFTIYLSFTQLTSYSFECWWVEHFLNVFFLAAACFS